MAALQGGLVDPAVVRAAERLRHAQTTYRPCPSVRDLIGGGQYAAPEVADHFRSSVAARASEAR